MPAPLDVFALLEPEPNPHTYPDHWEQSFAPFQWFYVAGFRECLQQAKIWKSKELRKATDLCERACSCIPPEWQQKVPYPDWQGRFSPTQLERAKDQKKMTFDRACLSLVAAENILASRGTPIDVFIKSKIRPALFRIKGFDKKFYEKHIINTQDNYARVVRHTGQNNPSFFEDLADGYTATYTTLLALGRCIHDDLKCKEFDNTIYPLPTRSGYDDPDEIPVRRTMDKNEKRKNAMRKKRPARFEVQSIINF